MPPYLRGELISSDSGPVQNTMSQRKKDQLTAVYLLVLASFGIGLIIFAIWVFCVLSGPELGTCVVDSVTPF